MTKIVYVVTRQVYEHGGGFFDILGVFTDKTQAELLLAKNDPMGVYFIEERELNTIYPPSERDDWGRIIIH